MGRKKKVMQPKEEIADDFCFVCKDGGFLQICDYRDCLKAYHPHCVGNDQSILETETETEWNCRWHSCFICQKSSTYRCLCCPISVCGRCIRRDAEFVPIKKKKTGLCNNCLKLAIMIEEKADVDSDGGKVDFQDRTTSEYLFKNYWEIVNEKEGLTLEDLHAVDSRLKRHQVFESGSEIDADEVLEEEMLAEAALCLRDLCSGRKTSTKRYKSKKKTLLAWSLDESLEEGENSKKPRRILSDSGPKSEQNHCKKKVTEQPKSEYAAIVEKNINSLYLRKSLALKLLGDPETFEHKVRGCFVRVRADPKNFYSSPFKQYQLGQVKGVKKVDHAYQVGEVNTDVVLCITNMNDVRISMLSDEDIEEEDYERLRLMVKKGTFKRPSIAELDKKIRSMHRDIMSHWIDWKLSRLAKKIERANDKGWRAESFDLIDERELLRTPKEQNRLLDEIPSIIADMEDLPAAAREITSMEIDDVHVAALETISVEIEGNTSASVEKVGLKVAKGGVNATSMEVSVQEVEDMSSGERDPPPPIRGKGKGIMSNADFRTTRRRNRPSPSIVIRESADGYSHMPSTFTPSRSAVAPRPSVPAQHPPVPTPCLPPPSHVSPSPPPPVAPTSPHINIIPTLGIMTNAHHSASASASMAEEQQYSPGYSRSPSDANVHEQPEEVKLMADDRPIIRPSGNGFLPSKKAASAISFVIQQGFHRALLSWGNLTSDERINMFDAFRGQAAWRIEHESEIERIFHHKASTRLSDMLRETRERDSQPPWIGDGTWQELRRYWDSDEFKKKSDQAKKNRASEKGGSLHTGGCVSHSQWAERMARQYNRGVQIHEVHKRTHTRKGTGEYIDERSKRTQEEFHLRMSQARSQTSSSSPSNSADPQEDERIALNVWTNVVGGKHKGRLYGAGDLAGNYRKGPSSRMLELRVGASTGSRHRPQESAEIAQLRQMLASSQERERQRDEEHRQMMDTMRQRDEENRQMMDQMRQMMETVQQLQQQQSTQQPPQQRQRRRH